MESNFSSQRQKCNKKTTVIFFFLVDWSFIIKIIYMRVLEEEG